jgi:DNA-directed RNA polymerase subunit M/transcription elongation factor TFIIS
MEKDIKYILSTKFNEQNTNSITKILLSKKTEMDIYDKLGEIMFFDKSQVNKVLKSNLQLIDYNDKLNIDIDRYINKPDVKEGNYKCKCGSNKTYFYQLQTRSSDEPMTTFITCIKCGNKWKD